MMCVWEIALDRVVSCPIVHGLWCAAVCRVGKVAVVTGQCTAIPCTQWSMPMIVMCAIRVLY